MKHSLSTPRLSMLLTVGLLTAAPLQAQQDVAPPPEQNMAKPAPADTPPPAMPREEQEGIEPQVTIIRKEDRTIEEYRINGQLYMIKVTPSKGYPYYLVDADGDGNLETRRNELDPHMLVPSWVIFRW